MARDRDTNVSIRRGVQGGGDDLPTLANRWLTFLSASGRASVSTVRSYECDLRQFANHLEAAGHSMIAGEVTPQDVVRFRDSHDDWNPATVKRKLAAISSFFRWLVEHGHAYVNPAASVRRPDASSASTVFVTPDDALSMFLQCRDDRERACAAVS